jgi:hypothetical protein
MLAVENIDGESLVLFPFGYKRTNAQNLLIQTTPLPRRIASREVG